MTIINNSNINNNSNNADNNKNNGGKVMKNTIKATRQAEVEAREAAAKEAAKKARLDAIEPIDIVETMTEVEEGTARSYRDENGVAIGTNGGVLFQKPVKTRNGITTIAAENPEALAELEQQIENGRQGDGLYHKTVYIGGIPCDCVGHTPEELEQDIAAAEDYYKKHSKGSVIRDIDVAEQLVDAEYHQEDLEQITGSNGRSYLISYDGNYVMDLDGTTMATLEDLKASSILSREDVKTLLVERLEAHIAEERARGGVCHDFPEDDWDDEYDEEDDEYEDDEEDDDDEPMTIKIRLQ